MTQIQPLPEQTDAALRDVMEVLQDGRKGFGQAAEKLEEDGHAELAGQMRDFAEQRQRLLDELRNAASGYARVSDEEGSTAAALHRSWMALTDALSGDDPHAVLSVAEQGEDHAKEVYEDILREDLPDDLRAVLNRQATQVIEAHDQVRELRDAHA